MNTKIEAYKKVLPDLPESRLKVYKALKKLEYATNNMIADLLGWRINRITGRCKELRDLNLVEFSHISRCPITKVACKYWKIEDA